MEHDFQLAAELSAGHTYTNGGDVEGVGGRRLHSVGQLVGVNPRLQGVVVAGAKAGNKGADAAISAVEMVNLAAQLKS